MTSLAGNVPSAAATPLLRRTPERQPASGELRALIAVLSPAKRAALVACLAADGLHKQSGAWHGTAGGKPISGVTVADLGRDGLLALSSDHRLGFARLTELGAGCAMTLRDDGANTPLATSP